MTAPNIKWLDAIAEFLDNRFRIPFTNIRFGVDALIGLIPYAGDVLSFAVSGVLVLYMARHGGSGMLAVKMVGNILLDGIVGTVPLLGDLFDLRYRANLRNVHLLKQHYEQGLHKGSAWWVLFLILGAMVFSFVFSLWLVGKVIQWIF